MTELEIAYPSMEWVWQTAETSRLNDSEYLAYLRKFARADYQPPSGISPNPYMQGMAARLLRLMDEQKAPT